MPVDVVGHATSVTSPEYLTNPGGTKIVRLVAGPTNHGAICAQMYYTEILLRLGVFQCRADNGACPRGETSLAKKLLVSFQLQFSLAWTVPC